MEFTELTIRLLLLFFPGIVCFLIVDALTVRPERKPHQILLLGYVYGVLSYIVYSVCRAMMGLTISVADGLRIPPPAVSFLQAVTDSHVRISFPEIGVVTLVAVLLAFVASKALNDGWLHRFARKIAVTRKFADPDVWSFTFNAHDVNWAAVRDYENGLIYQGYIQAFSDVESPSELLLIDLAVYDEKTGEERFRTDRMYLSRSKDSLTIELPKPRPEGTRNGGQTHE